MQKLHSSAVSDIVISSLRFAVKFILIYIDSVYTYRIGAHNLSYVSIMSLAVQVPKKTLSLLKKVDRNFKHRWLQDEIIAAFLCCLERSNDSVKYCGPTEALALSYSRSVKLLWSKQDLSNIKLVFIAYNPSDNLWILVVLRITEEEIVILDPLQRDYNESDPSHQMCVKVGRELFSRKFRQNKVVVALSPDHILQKDCFNCGVYVCYYARQLCEGKLFVLCFQFL